jgi:hypothetical protein
MAELAAVLVERRMPELRENRVVEGDVGVGGVEQDPVAVEDDETKVVACRNGAPSTHG